MKRLMSNDNQKGTTDSLAGEATPRGRVQAAWRGEMPDRVPFVIWNNKLPGEPLNQQLLDAGACVVVKASAYEVATPGIRYETEEWVGEDGFRRCRTVCHTPGGVLDWVDAFRPGTVWREKEPFEGIQSYDALLALIGSRQIIPSYTRFAEADRSFGEYGIARPATIANPMHEIIYSLLGPMTFALEWADHRDYVLALYQALLQVRRRMIDVVADSPAYFVVVEANISFEIVGHQRFQEYYLPVIHESCEVLHAKGKLCAAHLDGNSRQIAPLIAQTALDFIESFTPPPDCDLSVREARQVWPGKALCINFPSSVHLGGIDAVTEMAGQLLSEGAPGDALTIGVLEDVPSTEGLVPLARYLQEHGRTPIRVGST